MQLASRTIHFLFFSTSSLSFYRSNNSFAAGLSFFSVLKFTLLRCFNHEWLHIYRSNLNSVVHGVAGLPETGQETYSDSLSRPTTMRSDIIPAFIFFPSGRLLPLRWLGFPLLIAIFGRSCVCIAVVHKPRTCMYDLSQITSLTPSYFKFIGAVNWKWLSKIRLASPRQ